MSDITVTVTNAGSSTVSTTNGSTYTAAVGSGGSVNVSLGTTGGTVVTGTTVQVGTVSTLSAGSSATVTNKGTAYAAVLDFGIPAGAAGATGSAGAAGKDGKDGTTPDITIGTVTTGAAGSSAAVKANTVSGGVSLDFTIPRGDTGATGSGGGSSYTLPTASDTVLGGIKVGTGLAISSGVLSATGGTGGIGANDTVDGGDYVGTGSTGGGGGGSSSTDSLWSSVRLLVNADGAAYGYDSSSNKCYVSSIGNAAATTTNPKWGTKSLAFDGAGDYLYVNGGTASLAFGTGDFTAETWLYMNSLPASGRFYSLFDSREVLDTNNPTGGFNLLVADSGTFYAGWQSGGSSATQMSGGSASSGTWFHIALVRSSGQIRLYVGGILAASSTTNTNANLNGETLFISRNSTYSTYLENNGLMGYLNGYLDDVRLTAAARYTGTSTTGTNFTVPTAAFPTS